MFITFTNAHCIFFVDIMANVNCMLLLLLELLDKAEFGEAATNAEYDENAIAPASELGLMVGN